MSSSGQASKARQILKVWGGRPRPPLLLLVLTLLFVFACFLSRPAGGLDGRDARPSTNFLHRMSAREPRSFCVARNKVFFAVSSVVFKISPTVLNFNP